MASKSKSVSVCSGCGFESPKWYGKCPGCGEWNTMSEEICEPVHSAPKATEHHSMSRPISINEIDTEDEQHYQIGLSELGRVLGGGIVRGSLILISGDLGIGKSTILLQVYEYLGQQLYILYVSGKESSRQIKLRAHCLGVSSENLLILTETDIQIVVEQIQELRSDLVMIDFIQTMNHPELSSSPGSMTQVGKCTNYMMRTAKLLDTPIIVMGHVNRDGVIVGPKVLECIVDAVLYFKGDRQMSYRILRAVKNRYGSANEIGVFDTSEKGLSQVDNPSMALLSGRPKNASGTCVTCVMEGTRPILAEVQGLTATTGFGNPRRTVTGFDYNHMSLLLAALEKKAGYYFSNLDAYVNIVGGLRLDESAADPAVAMALISSLKDAQIGDNVLVSGEIGLTGELRPVSHMNARIAGAAHLGFKTCILPHACPKQVNIEHRGIQLTGVRNIREAFGAAAL